MPERKEENRSIYVIETDFLPSSQVLPLLVARLIVVIILLQARVSCSRGTGRPASSCRNVDVGSPTCAKILVRAVRTKARRALTGVDKEELKNGFSNCHV